MQRFSLFILCALFTVLLAPPAARAAGLKSTSLTTTNAVRYTSENVARVVYVDCRSILPAGSTVSVSRVASTLTNVIATIECSAGHGREAPLTNETWYALYGEYFSYSGATSGVVRVITEN